MLFRSLLVILILLAFGWIVFVHLRARRLGLPTPTFASYNPFASSRTSYTPTPRTGGLIGWFNNKLHAFRYRRDRTAGGSYEEPLGTYGAPSGGGRARAGFGALDPDDAWDARVGTEADAYGPGGYNEEQELGLHADTEYAGAGGEERGRTRGRREEPSPYGAENQRELDRRHAEEVSGGEQKKPPRKNPFDDSEAAPASLRGVSPRPVEIGEGARGDDGLGADPDSPTERRSSFRENM